MFTKSTVTQVTSQYCESKLAWDLLGTEGSHMRKTALFAAAVGVLVLIGVDAWLSIRTMTQGALAGSMLNPFTITTAAKASHYNDYLFAPD
jgi:hypothetical protein